MAYSSNYALYQQLLPKLGEEETRALLDHIDQKEQEARHSLQLATSELKKELVTREILRAELKAELAEQKAELVKNFYTPLLAFAGIIIAAVFAIVKL